MALKGTLKDFGIADIFQLIAHQQKTGILDLDRREEQIQIVFEDGFVIMAEPKVKRKGEKLGELLLRSKLISEQDLEEALEVQKETLQKLGDILIERGVLNKDGLRKVLRLQTEEVLFRVLQWEDGLYEFHQMPVRYERDIYRQISAEHILMEGYRRLDEWKVIRSDVPSPDMVFNLGAEAIPCLEEGKLNLDRRELRKLSEEDKKILSLIDGNRTVREIRDVSLLGEFESLKAFSNLLKGGFIEQVRSGVEVEGDAEAPAPKATHYVQIVMGSALVFLLWAAVMGFGLAPSPVRLGASSLNTASPQVAKMIWVDSLHRQLEEALEVYQLREGTYPAQLEQLSQTGIFRFPFFASGERARFYYSNQGDSYLLLLPRY